MTQWAEIIINYIHSQSLIYQHQRYKIMFFCHSDICKPNEFTLRANVNNKQMCGFELTWFIIDITNIQLYARAAVDQV